jgi:hypothetical protein
MQRLAQHGAAAKKRKSSTGLVVGAVAVVGVALFAFKKMGGDTPPESQAAPPQETAKKAEPEPAKTSTPPSVDIGTPPVVTPAESVETERGKEAMSTPPATAAPSVPTPPPVTPPAVAEASSTPPPPVAPAGELSPALTRLKIEFTERYKTEIQARLQIAQREIGDKYLAALTKLEQGFMSKTDAAAVLQVRKEKDRFAKALAAPTASEMAPQDQLADYQKKLATALENLKKSVAAPVAKLNAEFAEAVDKLASSLEADGKKEQADAVKTFREKGKGVPDHLGILSGAVEQAAAAPDAVMEKGNLGLANRGAEALAENKPELIIDGESSQDSSGWSSVGGSIVVNLAKTYQLSNIYVRFPRRDRASWNFYLEVSPDGNQWAEVGDRRKGRVTGYQLFHLAPARPVKSIRLKITGIDGTERFLVEEVQAFCPVGNASADVKSPFDLKELICSSQWTWEKPDDSSEGLTFVPDGVVVQRYFDGTFEAMDSNTVTLTHKDRTTQLKFSADYQSYSGFDFDGKTPIKGTRKKPGQL